MSNRHPIKETVKVLYITKPNQKIKFQIRHPENVYAIIGIAVTCSLALSKDERGIKANTAGVLNLAIAEKGDVAFSEDLKLDNNNYLDATEKQINSLGTPNGIQYIGKRLHYFETNYRITEALLEGYYEDVFSQKVNEPIKSNFLYKVSVYIRYQTLKSSKDEN